MRLDVTAPKKRRILLLATVSSLLFAIPYAGTARAQTQAAPPQAEQPAPADAESYFSREELEKLLAPIALFPDALLAQILPAAAYPVDIVQASRWLARNKEAVAKQDFSAADAQSWDASVKALMRFPDVLERMNNDLDWTTDLGDAFVHQPQDVATVIQDLRAKAAKAGALRDTPQQKVVRRTEGPREVIIIESAQPDVIFVPSYDPVAVFSTTPSVVPALLTFGTAVALGAVISNNNNYWNWGSGAVYRPIWPGNPAWRPPYNGWRPGMPNRPGIGGGNNNNINIGGGGVNIGGGGINIGGGGGNNVNIGNNLNPWRPDPDRYRPGLGSKPGLGRPVGDRPGQRPGINQPGINRPGVNPPGVNRPGIGQPGITPPANRPGGNPGVNRPGGGAAGIQRPTTLPASVPATRPATRPTPPAARPPQINNVRPGGAFGGVGAGSAAGSFANRGNASMQRPAAVNRPAPGMNRPAMGGGQAVGPRGGGGGRVGGGGGGGGGGRGRR